MSLFQKVFFPNRAGGSQASSPTQHQSTGSRRQSSPRSVVSAHSPTTTTRTHEMNDESRCAPSSCARSASHGREQPWRPESTTSQAASHAQVASSGATDAADPSRKRRSWSFSRLRRPFARSSRSTPSTAAPRTSVASTATATSTISSTSPTSNARVPSTNATIGRPTQQQHQHTPQAEQMGLSERLARYRLRQMNPQTIRTAEDMHVQTILETVNNRISPITMNLMVLQLKRMPLKMEETCSICDLPYKMEDYITQLPCGHMHHYDCLLECFVASALQQDPLLLARNKFSLVARTANRMVRLSSTSRPPNVPTLTCPICGTVVTQDALREMVDQSGIRDAVEGTDIPTTDSIQAAFIAKSNQRVAKSMCCTHC